MVTAKTHSRLSRGVPAGGTLTAFELPRGKRTCIDANYRTEPQFARGPSPLGGDVVIHRETSATPDDWTRSHARELGRYAGHWLAVSRTGIAAVGDSLPEVRQQALAKGLGRNDVIVFKIPAQQMKKAVGARKR